MTGSMLSRIRRDPTADLMRNPGALPPMISEAAAVLKKPESRRRLKLPHFSHWLQAAQKAQLDRKRTSRATSGPKHLQSG
jgi:hypothetical protein